MVERVVEVLDPVLTAAGLGNHLGSHLQWTPAAQKMAATPAVALTMEQIAEPFPETRACDLYAGA